MADPDEQARMQAQIMAAQGQALTPAQMQAQMMAQQQQQQQQGFPGALPGTAPPGAPVPSPQPSPGGQEMTLAQIAAAQQAKQKKKATPKAKKAQEDAAAAAQQQQQQMAAMQQAQQRQQVAMQQQQPPGAPAPPPGAPVPPPARPAVVPLRQRPPQQIVDELRANLELIRREYAENVSAAARSGKEYEPPSFVASSQYDAATGIELWLTRHAQNFNAVELEKKIAMLRGIQEKCRAGALNPANNRARIEALACWVELTKTYYICVRESRNLTLRGVAGIQAPTFRLPETAKSIPPPRAPDDAFNVAELDVAMRTLVGAQKWVEEVETQMIKG
jgi:hypothetical protein